MKFFRTREPRLTAFEGYSGDLPNSLEQLPLGYQLKIGGLVVSLLIVSFVLTKSLIGIVVVLAPVLLYWLLSSPLASILGFMAANVLVAFRIHTVSQDGAPTALDLLVGLVLAVIIGYWSIKIRIIEQRPLSGSVLQLILMLFFVWALLVSAGGIILANNPPGTALREILNISPLFILPILYERYIVPGSKEEDWLFGAVLFSGSLLAIANVLTVRNNLAQAYYLYQVGKATLDIFIAPFIIVMLLSFLMSEKHWWRVAGAIAFILTEGLVVLLSTTRNAYVGMTIAATIVWLLGSRNERALGARRLSIIGGIAGAGLIVSALSSKLISLLLEAYWKRLLTTQRLGHDLSMRMKFAEWSAEWNAIKQSPIVGHGFGASFRVFDIFFHYHSWIAFSHNSYLYIIFKTGFIGGLLFLIPFFAFMYKAYKLSRIQSLPSRIRIGVRGCVGCMVLLVFATNLGPVFDSKTDLMWVGLLWGYLLAVEKQIRNSKTIPQYHSLY